MSHVKAIRYPVTIHVTGDVLKAHAPSKQALELLGGAEDSAGASELWSGEELLVVSAAASYARTLAVVAERLGIELEILDVTAAGHVSIKDDGRYGFVALELTVTADAGLHEPRRLFEATQIAQERSRVLQALDVPVHVRVRYPESRLAQELAGSISSRP